MNNAGIGGRAAPPPNAGMGTVSRDDSESSISEGGGGAHSLHSLVDVTHNPMMNHDGTEMYDESGHKVYRSQFLSTHPLRTDCKERMGFGGKKFTYVSGDGVIRTMNQVFGHGGWSTELTMERMVMCEKDAKGRWNIGYLATVRVKLRNGVSHEDCGSGESIDPSKIKCHDKAMKSAITDAMKRAARHFGERLGNALYVKGNGIKVAPKTNKDALAKLEKTDALNLFGDQSLLRPSPDRTYTSMHQSPGSWSVSSRLTRMDDSIAGQIGLVQGQADLTPVRSVPVSHNPTTLFTSRPLHPPNNQAGTATPQRQLAQANASARSGPAPAGWNNAPNPPHLMPPPTNLPNLMPPPTNLPNLMPPPKPMYNPGGSGAADSRQASNGQFATALSSDIASSAKRGANSSENDAGAEKRLKKNPYSRNVSC